MGDLTTFTLRRPRSEAVFLRNPRKVWIVVIWLLPEEEFSSRTNFTGERSCNVSKGSQMSTLQRQISVEPIIDLNAQMREVIRLRDLVRKAELRSGTMHGTISENTAAVADPERRPS
jgi:hypothetical protein